jgi:tRNA (guanine-N7-)-methyltransferase
MIQALQKTFQHFFSAFATTEISVIMEESYFRDCIRFDKIYSNYNPIVVEFGVGKGRFMRDYALKSPKKNFLGVEKVNKWIKHTAQRIKKANLSNVKLINSTAELILSVIPSGSVSEFYVLFPDPWPKRRHNGRRVIQKKFLLNIHEALSTNGKFYIATDHAEYFEWMKALILPMIDVHFELIQNERPEFTSNYQIKYEREGRPIYNFHLRKI